MVDVKPGIRVVRGPDWERGDEDGGEGYVGTVVSAGRAGDGEGRHDLAMVQWDVGGERRVYRCGAENKYDLRVIDSASAGTIHKHRECIGCGSESIAGCLWRCFHCLQYYLCTPCYMKDRHSTWHHFLRIDSPENPGQRTRVECRYASSHVRARGIFVGARVIRGRDWRWGDQDGGEGKEGTVVEITGWQSESSRSVAVVEWQESGLRRNYRLGHKGKVDLRCTMVAEGGHCYMDHLPLLGSEYNPSSTTMICAGDRARLEMDLDLLKSAQEKIGRWRDNLPMFLGSVGVVVDVSLDGSVARIIFYVNAIKFDVVTKALKKIEGPDVYPGDVVRVIDDITEVHRLQKEGRGWDDDIVLTLGQLGRMPILLEDGNAVVVVDGRRWIFDPLCLTPAPGEQPDDEETEQELSPGIDSLLFSIMEDPNSEMVERMAKNGHAKLLRDFLEKHPDKLNALHNGRTLLHVAATEGRLNVIRLLLDFKADVTIPMRDGGIPLHSAVYYNQYEVVKLLIEAGSDLNKKDIRGNTPVHIASGLGCSRLLQFLIQQSKCDINVQNDVGDTPLHLSCVNLFPSTTGILLEAGADVTMFDGVAANPLHHSINIGFDVGVHMMVESHPELINMAKIDDGSTPLHIAASIGNHDGVSYLASIDTCNLEAKTYTGTTPLFVACKAGRTVSVEYLVGYGADATSADELGSTPLHFVLAKKKMRPLSKFTPFLNEPPEDFQDFHELVCSSDNSIQDVPPYITVACFLISEGADPDVRAISNNNAYTSIGFCPVQYRPLLRHFGRPEQRGSYRGSLLRHPPPVPKPLSVKTEPLASNTVTSGEPTAPSPATTTTTTTTTSATTTNTVTQSETEAAPTEQTMKSSHTTREQTATTSTSSNAQSNNTTVSVDHKCLSGPGCFLCEGPCDIIFRPCGHTSMCSVCSDRIKRCPTCRNDVLQKIKVRL